MIRNSMFDLDAAKVLITVLLLLIGSLIVGVSGELYAQNQTPPTDNEITNAIEGEFLADFAVPLNDIDVWTEDGITTLSGTVSNLLASERATRLAETVRGVRAVINQVRVAPAVHPRVRDLHQAIEDALLADPATDSYEITVTANDQGSVTLTGTVDSWAEKELAGQVTKGVYGVTAVQNNIDITYASTRPDEEIEAEIGQRMRWDALVDHALVEVQSAQGAVTLSGTVGSAAEKRRAYLDAWVAGVVSVDNSDLEVKAWMNKEELRDDKYVVKSDEEIRDAVIDALHYDPRVAPFDVTVEIVDGFVTLKGVVDNLSAKHAAARDARHTVGVVNVRNRLKVRPAESLSDEAIADNVRQALQRHPYIERYEITVAVNDGTVLLYETVDSLFLSLLFHG